MNFEEFKQQIMEDLPGALPKDSPMWRFKKHPFQVRVDEEMMKTVESIVEYGVLTPAIVRPRKLGGYEIISGHRRAKAADMAGLFTLPCIVKKS